MTDPIPQVSLPAGSVLCVASSSQDREELRTLLGHMGMPVSCATGIDEALATLAERRYPFCLLVLDGNGESVRVVRAIRNQHPSTVVIGIADPARPASLPDALRAGAFDILPRPLTARNVASLLANAAEQAALVSSSPESPPDPSPFGIVGNSLAMRDVMDMVRRAAPSKCGVLVCGERGTGREMVARAIHSIGAGDNAPFVKVDCASPTPQDLEHHLFGTVSGRKGGFEARSAEQITTSSQIAEAVGGTLFLENVVETPARVQSRLARLLRDREVVVSGSREPIEIDLRPIAAVEPSIDAALEEARLRLDLYERLSLIRIDLPALRQRREDIPVLAAHFLKELSQANGQRIKTLTRPALTLLSALPWRGNARELRGLLERLVVLVPQGIIRLEDVLAHIRIESSLTPVGPAATLREARNRFEREYISSVLQQHKGRMAEVAQVLGIQRTNLYRKMRQLSMPQPRRSSRD
jgi:DNA-binding NtrC family response regulator